VLIRLNEEGVAGALARAIVSLLPAGDTLLASDIARLEEVRRQRAEAAASYFRANAENWEKLRSLHVREEDVEAAMLRLIGESGYDTYLDLGTGTGRILRLFAPYAARAIGIDSSREMLAMARAHRDTGESRIEVRHGDIYALPYPNAWADFITIHQVLHYLDEPLRAIIETARVLKPGGRLLITDFAPHEREELRERHAHRRLGISGEVMAEWLARAGLALRQVEVLPPPSLNGETGLGVSIWLSERPVPASAPAAIADARIA
jgi:ubiquinone/menaquinone biosynthesis C-methylase UbiE